MLKSATSGNVLKKSTGSPRLGVENGSPIASSPARSATERDLQRSLFCTTFNKAEGRGEDSFVFVFLDGAEKQKQNYPLSKLVSGTKQVSVTERQPPHVTPNDKDNGVCYVT